MRKLFILLILLLFSVFSSSEAVAFSGKVGTYFFWWYRCPDLIYPDPYYWGDGGCDPTKMPYRGVGTRMTYPEGGYYHTQNINWYKREFTDMTASGITDAYVVAMVDPNSISLMTQAIRETNSPLKLGFFWDVFGNWDLGNPSDRERLYSNFIKVFYQSVPFDLWSTTLYRGEYRPIVLIGGPHEGMVNLGDMRDFLKEAKNRFLNDFHTVPFFIVEWTWFRQYDVDIYADAEFNFGASAGLFIQNHKYFKVAALGPGADARLIGYPPESYADRQDGNRFRNNLAGVPLDTKLMLIETWNEILEGTGIARYVDYFDSQRRPMKDISYMQILQEYLGKPAIPIPTVSPPAPSIISASCNSQNCSFSWSSLAAIYADNVRYMYKIFDSTLNGQEKLCPPYTFDNDNNTYHGGGCWRGNTEDTILKSSIINDSRFATACPNGVCTLSVWAKDGNNNVSPVATATFTPPVGPVISFSRGWNKISFPQILGIIALDLPNGCSSVAGFNNGRLTGFVRGFWPTTWAFFPEGTHFIRCASPASWQL